jgi:2-phosphosulfolactate phosphatase
MIIRHVFGFAGAATVTGPAIVIDVFRAFSAAAYALDAGATKILLTAEVDAARKLAATMPDSVLMGEVDGMRPDDFKLGNSPGEIQANPHLVAGRTIVHRSSAGTQCALAALENGANPVYVSSFVVASATASAAIDLPEVTIVASGLSGVVEAVEDTVCANLLGDLLLGSKVDLAASAEAVAATDRAQLLQSAAFAHPDDVRLCGDVDRFSFAMLATTTEGVVTVHRVD